jgi:hypothetical protein
MPSVLLIDVCMVSLIIVTRLDSNTCVYATDHMIHV